MSKNIEDITVVKNIEDIHNLDTNLFTTVLVLNTNEDVNVGKGSVIYKYNKVNNLWNRDSKYSIDLNDVNIIASSGISKVLKNYKAKINILESIISNMLDSRI